MAKRQYQDAEGNWVEIDDEVSLLGPVPKDQPKESTRDTRYQPIQYDYSGGPKAPTPEHDPRSFGPKPQSDEEKCKDASNSGLNDPAYRRLMGKE
jgi:hypothetical protein